MSFQNPDRNPDIEKAEVILGYTFRIKNLLARALTTKAFAQERHQKGEEKCQNQEVFCTLGDTLIKTIITEMLIEKECDSQKVITEERKNLESREALGNLPIAKKIASFMRLGNGEQSQKTNLQSSVIAENFEAVVAAIYYDAGWDKTKELLSGWLFN